MPKKPTPAPDEFGRYRVRDEDTGHERTVTASELAHGNYVVLDEPASDHCGNPVAPVFAAAHESPVEPINSGQLADPEKEKADA